MNSSIANERSHFNELLIRMEHDLGTRDTCIHFLESMELALHETHFKSIKDVQEQFIAFYEMFTHLKPRMAIIQHYLDSVLESIGCSKDTPSIELIEAMSNAITNARKDNAERNNRLKHMALQSIKSNAHILVHSHSHTVLDTLQLASHTHKKFSVIVAEQETSRTLDIAKFLNDHSIPFTVVPEYMLSSIEMDITCMLIGAVTLKHDLHFVVDAGTKAVVSEMNAAKIPVYLMLTTNKFSYWKTKAALQTQKTVKNIAHPHADFSFERVKFSHDRLPLSQINHIITEEGIYTPTSLVKSYKEKLAEYQEMHKEIAKKRC